MLSAPGSGRVLQRARSHHDRLSTRWRRIPARIFRLPTFLWRDGGTDAVAWQLEITPAGAGRVIRARSAATRRKWARSIRAASVQPTVSPHCLPRKPPAHTWKPDAQTWEAVKRASSGRDAIVTITGYADQDFARAVSRGRVTIRTSEDPVGAPIFYRDVPLMPSELEKGVIKPLAPRLLPYIAWRLRDVARAREPGRHGRDPHVRELPLVLARRQNARAGPGRAAQRQGAVRDRSRCAPDVDS